MIGIVIVTHSHLGEALIDAAECILGEPVQAVAAVSIDLKENVDRLRQKIEDGIKEVNQNQGILILTDMFGGTPSNLSYSLLDEGRVEVISGVNLPILVKALNLREKERLADFVKTLETYGRKSITLASGLLKGNKRS